MAGNWIGHDRARRRKARQGKVGRIAEIRSCALLVSGSGMRGRAENKHGSSLFYWCVQVVKDSLALAVCLHHLLPLPTR